MANRYWVGGTASWDATAGTKWSTTSGGAGGASVPTTADDVFFDANSTGTVTIATGNSGAKSINCTGFTGTLTGTAALTIAGSLTLVSGMTFSATSAITFTATATITSAGKTLRSITIDCLGGTVTLADAIELSNNLIFTRGTFDSASYSISAGAIYDSGSSTKVINFNSSTVNISTGIGFSNLLGSTTFNAGTSQINLTGANSSVGGTVINRTITYYNVSFTSTASNSLVQANSGRRLGYGPVGNTYGTDIFNNLTLSAAASGVALYSIGSDSPGDGDPTITVNRTFTTSSGSTSPMSRSAIHGALHGRRKTITASGINSTNCDFRDFQLSGLAAGASLTGAGNCGNNSGIVFPSGKTVYRVGSGTNWKDSTSWAATSGGAGADSNFPLPQDTAIIDNNATTSTLTLDSNNIYNFPSFDASARTNALTVNLGTLTHNWNGNFALGTGITLSNATNNQYFYPSTTRDFISNGITIPFELRIFGYSSGVIRLGDAFSSTKQILLYSGTFNANTYNVTITTFTSAKFLDINPTLSMGSGLWTLSSTGAVWNLDNNTLVNKDTANILLSSTSTASRTFFGGSRSGTQNSYNKLTIGGATGTSTLAFSTYSPSFTELASTKTVAHTIDFDLNLGTIGTWSITGSAGNVVTVKSSLTGTRRTFTLTNATTGINYLSVKDIGELSGNKFYVGIASTDGGNNSNVYFTAAPGEGASGNMMMLF